MADILNITFNTDADERLANTVSMGTDVGNNAGRVAIDPSEFYDGDACGLFDGEVNTFLEADDVSGFDFGNGDTVYFRAKIQAVKEGEYAVCSRRESATDRWHILINLETSTLTFYVETTDTVRHNISYDFSGDVTLELGKWFIYEMSCNSSGKVRHWINGVLLTDSTYAGAVAPNAPLRLGYANTGDATPNEVGFERYMDSVLWSDTIPAGYDADADVDMIVWTGEVNELIEFTSPITPQPIINDPSAFPNNIADFTKGNNQLYIAGIKPMLKVQGTEINEVGLTAPGTVTFDGANAGSDFDYVVTWLDGDLNESPSSPVSATRGSSTNTVEQPDSVTVPDNAVYWRVYRRNVAGGQSRHYLVSDDIAIGTDTFDDTGGDENLFTLAPRLSIIVPPVANHVEFSGNRMFYGNVELENGDKYPTRVYYSGVNELEQVGVNSWFYVGQAGDDDYITGMKSHNGILVIFKEKSIWLAIGDPSDPEFQIIPLTQSVGCVAHQTIVEVDGYLLWLSDEAVHAWNSERAPHNISMAIEPLFENMPDLRKAYATAGSDEEIGLYLLSLSLESETENDTVLCYNYRESLKQNLDDPNAVHRWTTWDVSVDSLTRGYVGTGRNPRAIFVDKNGKLGIFERGLDLNAGIDFRWTTTRFNPFVVGSPMKIHYATAFMDLIGSGLRYLNFGFEIDEFGVIKSNFRNPTRNNHKIRVGSRADYIALQIEGFDIRNEFKLYGFSVQGSGVGRR
jgi:hypothetical protein